ncbi:MAG: NUDIX domain-containing protein [Candidatus Saccharimonadales bacterium]
MRTIIPKNAKLIPEEAERVFKGKIFDVYQWRQKMFDGSFETFEMLKRPDTVKVIAIKDGKIVICEEQQPNTSVFFDVPSGRHDVESESELGAAKREVLEETGMAFSNWRLISVEQPHTKIDWFVYIFLAADFISQTKQNLDTGEKITVHLKSFDEIIQLANDPRNRYIPVELLEKSGSIDGLLKLPEYN